MRIKENQPKNKLPLGIIIISIIYYLAAVLYLSVAILAFLKPDIIKEVPNFNSINPAILPKAFFSLGIIFIFLSVFAIIVATGLLKRWNFSRIALIVFCIFNIAGGILSLTEGNYLSTINLVFNLIIAVYLIFSKKVRVAFSKKD
jgi:hypothetical protein